MGAERAVRIERWGRVGAHAGWADVFDAWERVQRDYWTHVPDDIGWWSSERANVSLLGHAIWKARGFSLQEYVDEKGVGADRFNGRPDMYALIKRRHYIIEAKQCWPRLRGHFVSTIRSSFELAAAAARLNGNKDGCRTAVTFASYVVPGSQLRNYEGLVRAVRASALDVRDHAPAGFRVDLFPHGIWRSSNRTKGVFHVQHHAGWPRDMPNRYYVGVSLLVGFLD